MPSYELLAAYCRTDYRVEVPNRIFSIRLGNVCRELDDLLAETGHTEWAIITAENPRSVQRNAAENADRQERLHQRISAREDWLVFSTVARCPRSEWPPERGCLVAGITEADALQLAREFDQHAILCGSAGASAMLRFSDPSAWRAAVESGLRSDDDLLRQVSQNVLAAQLNR